VTRFSLSPGRDARRAALLALLAGLCLLPPRAASQIRGPVAAPAALQDIGIRQATLTARLGATRNRLARLLGALQRFSRDPPPPLFVPPREALDSVRGAILIRALTPDLIRRTRGLEAEERALLAQRRAAAAANGERFAQESQAADLQRVDGLVAASQSPAAPIGAGSPPTLTQPIEAAPSVRFGGQLSTGGASRGFEYAPDPGLPVASPAAGVVEYAGPLDGWGRVLILRGAGGYHMVLAGLAAIVVQPGQSVASGQTIGAMSNGANPAPHLYLEVRRDDEPIDPAPFFAPTRR
jgi:septal ring factor EnvC (AmiA/AmiB activator)